MKIKVDDIIDYLEKINVISDSAIIEITNEGLRSKVRSIENVAAIDISLSKDKFLEYETNEDIAINNIPRLINLLKMFTVPIINVSKDVLKIKDDSNEAVFLLSDVETTKNQTYFPKPINVDYTDGVKVGLKKDKINSIFKAASILNTDMFLITAKNNELSITVNNQDTFKTTIQTNIAIPIEVLIGSYFKECIDKIDKFTLCLGKDKPITLLSDDVKYIIAPIER